MLQEIEARKKQSLPMFASDGSIIQRKGYGDILDSEELFVYFKDNWYGHGDYANPYDQPVMTVYGMWLSDVYGKTAAQKAGDFVFSVEGLELMLGVAGLVFPPADVVSLVIDLAQGEWGYAALDAVGILPLAGDFIKWAGKGTRTIKGGKTIAGITYVYKAADTPRATQYSYRGGGGSARICGSKPESLTRAGMWRRRWAGVVHQ